MGIISLLMLTGLAAGALSCGKVLVADDPGTPVPLTRLASDRFSGFAEAQRIVVRSPEQWEQVWAALWQNNSNPPPVPQVDFTREMVLVAARGTSPNSGYDIVIDSASLSSSGLAVVVRSISPGAGCITLQVITYPVDIVTVPRTDAAVTFQEKAEVRDCN